MVFERSRSDRSILGFSLVELLIVLAITGILTAIALPQMVSQRRLTRSVGVTREIMAQMRFARQTAMSTRRAVTFQYDDSTKEIKIIGPITPGTDGLTNGAYPNNAGSATEAVPLGRAGLSPTEITYGVPAGTPALPTALGDGVSKTDLVDSKLNITFQPDGSVIDAVGSPVNRAMFIFNNKAALETASAISVLGSSGRIRVWRYSRSANKYE